MDKTQLKMAWVDALRSGQYTQHRGNLADNYENPTALCCVGVGGIAAGIDISKIPYTRIRTAYGMSQDVCDALFQFNDIEEKSFEQIASWIEAHDLNSGAPIELSP